MDRGTVQLLGLLGIVPALAVIFSLSAKRRARVPPLAWWLCLIVGAVTILYGLSHSTVPSFANPITAVGKAYDCVEVRRMGYTHFAFRFVPDGEEPVNIETRIILPSWGNPAFFDGRTLRVQYLKDSERSVRNEAIDIEILSGMHAGFHDSLDARPAGKWLGIPVGSALLGFGMVGLKFRKDDVIAAASDREELRAR